MSTIVVLALGLMVLPASVAEGRQSLTVNGQDVTSITLELGQSCTVEVVSDDGTSYTDYVGFDNRAVLGTFSHLETTAAAGDGATVTEYNTKPFYGYLVVARGKFIPPRPGVHFIFEYEAQEVGETDLKLCLNDPPPSPGRLLDSVHITIIPHPTPPQPMGTAFTYQGRLLDADSPADGLYDFQFELYDNPGPFAVQEGNTIDINDLDVIDGYFTVELDFGSEVFNGDARWLEIGVRPGEFSDPCEYTVLSPRVELTPTPYAIYAETAGGAVGGISGSGTANYIAKFIDPNTIGDSVIYESGGKVGIGTASPDSKLEVTGSSSGPILSGTNTGTGYAGYFEQAGSSNIHGGLNVTTAAGLYGAKIHNQGGYSGYHSYGLYSTVYGSDKGDSYGIYSVGRKYTSDTGGKAYGACLIAVNNRTGGESYGVYGNARGSGGNNYGVFGRASGGTTNYAGYFDGDVIVNGTLKTTAGAEPFVDGPYIICENNVARSTQNDYYTKVKEIKIGRGGTLRIAYRLSEPGIPGPAYGQIYRNGTPVGEEHDTISSEIVNVIEVIGGWSKGDRVQIYAKLESGLIECYAQIDMFVISVNNPIEAGARKGY